MGAQSPTNLLSGRAQDRLYQLQRTLSAELRKLSTHQSLLYGALQACDIGTQASLLQEYLERVDAVLSVVVRLRAFVARHSEVETATASESEAPLFEKIE
jgi:hypothetical protein